MQRSFGSGGTLKKLETIADYLHFYTTALTGKFRLTYFDAFAGSGEIPMKEALPLADDVSDLADVTEGSARRALRTQPLFDRYLFVDAKRGNVAELNNLRSEFGGLASRISSEHGDANNAIHAYCDGHRSSDRAVMFLDPFGNQVRWESIVRIAETPGIDLWYLFPAGLGVLRQISQDGTPHPQAESSLDEMFGTRDWRGQLIELQVERDLFGADREVSRRVASADAVTHYMISRMKEPFGGRVLDSYLPLGKGGGHWYSLLLAWSNPSGKASELVRRVGTDIMRRRG